MIISRLEGGLGNQMFQYAYGLYLAQKHGTELWLDTSSYANRPAHGYLLDQFCIEAKVVPPRLQNKIPRRYRAASCFQPKRFADYLSWRSLRRHKERTFGFRAEHLQVPNNRYLVGYWQSEEFFPKMRSRLLRHFTLRSPLSPSSQRVADRMTETNSVAIHIRRGDYLNPGVAQIYESLQLDYYLRSLHDWARSRTRVEVFVFSNDLPWCRQQLHLPWETHWVDHNSQVTAHEDLWLMSRAACCVIANSTFSWWAAWLNDRADKVVYAPGSWFRPGVKDDSHILPSDWNRDGVAPLSKAA